MIDDIAASENLIQPIAKRVENDPTQPAVILIENDESEKRITIGQLHRAACAFARIFRESEIKPGDIVILATGHSQELLQAFWGTLYAGAVPSVFAYKGPMSTTTSYIERLTNMVRNSGARLVVISPDLVSPLKDALTDGECRVLNAGAVCPDQNDTGIFSRIHFTSGEQTAYLQYTSGTTGMQKGVRLSHRAIIHFVHAFTRALHIKDNDVVVNWLPLYHDFGLFAGFISPLLFARPTVLISPFKWVRYPRIFLQAIHKHKGTISFLPNSAHNHTVRFVSADECDGLDVSSLRVLINGAEPVFLESQQAFLRHFRPYGFKESALSTGYGMAENTLGVTFSPVGERAPIDWVDLKQLQAVGKAVPVSAGSNGAKANVSSGIPLEGTEVVIVDQEGNHLPERNLGEIIIHSPSLFSGYQGHPELTDEVKKNGWYFSGDMGYLAEGHLYVCGRKKDLVIIGGHNIHPEDIESTAASVPGIYPTAVVAFGIQDEELGTEKAVLICGMAGISEASRKTEIERELRRRIFNRLEVKLAEIHFVKPNWVVKTQNGKIARSLNREKYQKKLR